MSDPRGHLPQSPGGGSTERSEFSIVLQAMGGCVLATGQETADAPSVSQAEGAHPAGSACQLQPAQYILGPPSSDPSITPTHTLRPVQGPPKPLGGAGSGPLQCPVPRVPVLPPSVPLISHRSGRRQPGASAAQEGAGSGKRRLMEHGVSALPHGGGRAAPGAFGHGG